MKCDTEYSYLSIVSIELKMTLKIKDIVDWSYPLPCLTKLFQLHGSIYKKQVNSRKRTPLVYFNILTPLKYILDYYYYYYYYYNNVFA